MPVPPALESVAGWAWRLLVVAGAVAVLGIVVAKLALAVIPVVVAIFLSTLLVPVARDLRERGWRRGLAAGAAFVGALAILGGAGAIVGPLVAGGVEDVNLDVRVGAEKAASSLGISEQRVSDALDRAEEWVRSNAETIGGGVVAGAVIALEVLVGIILALVFLFFFVKDGDRLWGWIVGLFPDGRRSHVDALGLRAYQTLGGYLRGIAVVGIVDAVLIGIALAVLGVPLVVPLAVLVFFGAFFPLVGAWISGLAAALVALADEGLITALIVVAWITVVQQVEGHLLYPVVVGRAIDLHPVVVLVALTAGGVVAGIAGAFFAIPFVAVLASWLEYLRPNPD